MFWELWGNSIIDLVSGSLFSCSRCILHAVWQVHVQSGRKYSHATLIILPWLLFGTMSISQLEFGPLVFPHLVACIVAKGRWFPMLPIDSKKKKKDFLRVSALIVFRADQRLDFLSAVSDILKIPNAQEISICQRRWERKRTWTSTLKMPRSTISLGKNTEPIKRHVHCLKTGSSRRLSKQINFPCLVKISADAIFDRL